MRVLVAGGGVAGLETALALRALAPELVETALLAPEPAFVYRPLSVVEPFASGNAHSFSLARLAAEAGATLTPGTLAAVDAELGMAETSAGGIPFDVLVLACGAVTRPALAGALHFGGFADVDAFRALLRELEAESVSQLAFVLPPGARWPVPLYELALLTASHLAGRAVRAELTLVTHEPAPLSVFGAAAGEAVGRMLADAGVRVLTGTEAIGYDGHALILGDGSALPAARAVALPALAGPAIAGVPGDADGFLGVDRFGRVRGLRRVFAAGDITAYPVKQGGLAAQAADAVAETIAAEAGALIRARPFRPVLRGVLLTGAAPAYLRSDGLEAVVSHEPLWWPPAKIVGRHLAPLLARTLRYGEAAPPAGGLPVQVELDPP